MGVSALYGPSTKGGYVNVTVKEEASEVEIPVAIVIGDDWAIVPLRAMDTSEAPF
jgi:hypothetical protein